MARRAFKVAALSDRDTARAAKRRAVERLLMDHEHLSDRELARRAGVSHGFVAMVRQEFADEPEAPRVGKDGKTRRLPTRKAPDSTTRSLRRLAKEIQTAAKHVPRSRRGELVALLEKHAERIRRR